MGARFFFVLDHVLRPKQLAVVPKVLVQPLRRVRQDGRQDRLQIVYDAQDDVDTRRRGSRVRLDLEPGLTRSVSWAVASQLRPCPDLP